MPERYVKDAAYIKSYKHYKEIGRAYHEAQRRVPERPAEFQQGVDRRMIFVLSWKGHLFCDLVIADTFTLSNEAVFFYFDKRISL